MEFLELPTKTLPQSEPSWKKSLEEISSATGSNERASFNENTNVLSLIRGLLPVILFLLQFLSLSYRLIYANCRLKIFSA